MSDTPYTHLTVCSTCADTCRDGEAGLGGGSKLYDLLEAQLSEHPYRNRIGLGKIRCLMACTRGCVVSVASEGKMQYLLSDFAAERELAKQLLDFAAQYDDSPTGITANHRWPPTIGQHFLARIPPTNPVDADWSDESCDL